MQHTIRAAEHKTLFFPPTKTVRFITFHDTRASCLDLFFISHQYGASLGAGNRQEKKNVVHDSAQFKRYPLSTPIPIHAHTAIETLKTLTMNRLIRTMSFEVCLLIRTFNVILNIMTVTLLLSHFSS